MFLRGLLIGFIMLVGSVSRAVPASAEAAVYVITIKDHQFVPPELIIPAHQKVKIIVDNQDTTPEEFESYELNREKVIAGKSKGLLFIGPLKPGRYPYFGDFHPQVARGVIVVQ